MNKTLILLRTIGLSTKTYWILLLFGSLASVATILIADDHQHPALQILAEARLKDLRASLAELAGDTGTHIDKARGVLSYHIGEQSADYDLLSQSVVNFNMLHAANPTDAEITAYLGSAYTLLARDYPWQGLFQVIPGPGFMRLHYTFKGVGLLNAAVAQDPKHPIVRLIRGITMTRMPGIFGNYTTGIEDLELLHNWIANPQNNLQYADILKDAAFRSEALFRLAETYWLNNDLTRSRDLFLQAADAAPSGSPIAVAARALAQ